ncbi:hypothetical protein HK101_004685, partial [Irineochytrium annulatum]
MPAPAKPVAPTGGPGPKRDSTTSGGPPAPSLPNRPLQPETTEAWFETYTWLNPIFALGASKFLTPPDLPPVPHSERAEVIHARLRPHLRITVGGAPINIWRSLYAEFGGEYITAGRGRLSADIVTVAAPFLLQRIVDHLQQHAADAVRGIGFVVALLLLQLVVTNGVARNLEGAMRTGYRARVALAQEIVAKSLRMGGDGSNGRVVSLLEKDLSRLETCLGSAHVLWSAPLQIVAAAVALVYTLGYSGLFGFAALACFVPIQSRAMAALADRRRRATAVSERRVGLIQEAVAGMRVVKLSGMQDAMFSRIVELRRPEEVLVKYYLYFRGTLAGVTQVVPMLALFVTLLAWWLITGGAEMDPPTVFFTMSQLYNLRVPLILLPQAVTQ